MLKAVLAGAAGAALMYVLDPRDGYHRLSAIRGRVISLFPSPQRPTHPGDGGDTASDVHVTRCRPIDTGANVHSGRSDSQLAARVEAELRGDPDVPPGQVTIRADHGRVVLRGRVDHPEQIGAILDRVRAIHGVNDVENRLHVSQGQPRFDRADLSIHPTD